MLEGSPGVGKTSLITALASATGNPLVRINLSEQTDLVDLFGSDAPAEGGKAGEFVWRDAPFLRAMQRGEWVLLDEMNLASQSVLEGLNACLDHRGEAYIPELDKSLSVILSLLYLLHKIHSIKVVVEKVCQNHLSIVLLLSMLIRLKLRISI